jgi:type I restriction enzyme S subunit
MLDDPGSQRVFTPLGSLVKGIQYGYTASATKERRGPRFLRITDLEAGSLDWRTIPYCECRNPDPYLLHPGDVVIARTGATTGKSYLLRDIPEPTVFASYLIRVRCSDELLPGFLHHFLESEVYWRQVVKLSYGTAQPGANASILSKLCVPLPPVEEQGAIARILDIADAAIERTRTAIVKARRVRLAIVQEFFESGVGRTVCADSPGKRLATGWRAEPTGKLLAMEPKNGLSPRTESDPPGFITFSIAAVRDGRVDLLNREHWKYARIEAGAAQDFLLRRGDLLIVRGNANPDLVGRCGMVEDVPDGCIYPDILKRVVFQEREDGILPKFAALAWNYPLVHNQVLKRAKTSNGTLKINSRDVCQIVLPIPPKRSQESLIEVVAAADRQISVLAKQLSSLEALKQGLMQDLLPGRGRVTGKT